MQNSLESIHYYTDYLELLMNIEGAKAKVPNLDEKGAFMLPLTFLLRGQKMTLIFFLHLSATPVK